MAHEISPGTTPSTSILFSNDAQTLLEVVCPSNPLPVSVDAGSIIITPVTSSTMTTSQVTVPATANGILILAANPARLGATVSNPGSVSVYISQQPTGLTTSNGFAIPGGGAYNIDEPLYLGAIYGIVASSTQVVTVVELT